MKLSAQLRYRDHPLENARITQELERAGVDVVWVPEAYSFDSVSLMGFLSARTERIELAFGILPIFGRSPAVIAQTAAGLDALSGGRLVLGLGASGPQVVEGWHGVPYDRPLARTREVVDICRKVWRRQPLTSNGVFEIPLPEGRGTGLGKALKLINHPERERIPIWLAALGDRNVQMAAEIAEGWRPHIFMPEKVREVWGGSLDAGIAKRSRELGTLQIAAGGVLAIEDDMFDKAWSQVRQTTALYVGGMGAKNSNFYNTLVQRYGFADAARSVQELYLSGRKAEAEAALPDDLLRRSNLIGTPAFVRERVAALREVGVTHLHVNVVSSDSRKTLERVKEWIS
ncbi:LLM class F420-dependent oxidoreductase [Mycolicibacterium hodleri]|uniref:LLM class F420-dependent oxidoreductase n=1 Tax=Mycolicibacterium hodleri TaxID=49897 RepID=A0A502E492_9MYCO|nr:LLM class F420-dependent oxidoreductase [Mycolicibacterium hodleri]TPG32453.1 LLM class F420-dependent oxidoreductase [Mycolicibacterium hodleri]